MTGVGFELVNSVDIEKHQIFENMPREGIDPGLLRPQRNVLSSPLHMMYSVFRNFAKEGGFFSQNWKFLLKM